MIEKPRKWLWVLGLVIASLGAVPRMKTNGVQLLLAQALSPNNKYGSLSQLNRAWRLHCWPFGDETCGILKNMPADAAAQLRVLEEQYLYFEQPISYVTDELRLPAESLARGGPSQVNSESGESGVLFGNGYFYLRFFIPRSAAECWAISFHTMHDAPPPVQLDLFLNGHLVHSFRLARGDQSWETVTITQRLAPGLHRVDIVFGNDFFDHATQADRNAYIENMTLLLAADERCANE